jgi:DHA1 family inner membrane transport protein
VVVSIADRAPLIVIMLTLNLLSLSAAGSSMVADSPVLLVLLLGLWGAAHTACVALCQVRVTLAGGAAPSFAMAMNISSANLGIAIGAVAGGFIVERWGVNAIGWGAAALTLITCVIACVIALLERDNGSVPAAYTQHGGQQSAG